MDAFTAFLNKMGLDPRVFGLGTVHGTPQPQELETFFSMVAVQPAPSSTTETPMADPSFDDVDVDGPIIEEFGDDDDAGDGNTSPAKSCTDCQEQWICENYADPAAPCPLEVAPTYIPPVREPSLPWGDEKQPLPSFLQNACKSTELADEDGPTIEEMPDEFA